MIRGMKLLFPLALISVLALGGCSTFEGLKEDLSKGYHSVAGTVSDVTSDIADPDPNEAKKKLPVYDGTCPGVSVRPDLRRLVEFYDPSKPTEAGKISEISIDAVRNVCRTENAQIVMQIDLSLSGKTGPKARVKPSDKPSFAYPYFVAVTDPQGNVLSKEIFAASVAYASDQKEIKQTESIFQNMPFPDSSIGQSYTVVVGFQLTPEQLAYNQANPATPARK
jgi:hypothetical protein